MSDIGDITHIMQENVPMNEKNMTGERNHSPLAIEVLDEKIIFLFSGERMSRSFSLFHVFDHIRGIMETTTSQLIVRCPYFYWLETFWPSQ